MIVDAKKNIIRNDKKSNDLSRIRHDNMSVGKNQVRSGGEVFSKMISPKQSSKMSGAIGSSNGIFDQSSFDDILSKRTEFSDHSFDNVKDKTNGEWPSDSAAEKTTKSSDIDNAIANIEIPFGYFHADNLEQNTSGDSSVAGSDIKDGFYGNSKPGLRFPEVAKTVNNESLLSRRSNKSDKIESEKNGEQEHSSIPVSLLEDTHRNNSQDFLERILLSKPLLTLDKNISSGDDSLNVQGPKSVIGQVGVDTPLLAQKIIDVPGLGPSLLDGNTHNIQNVDSFSMPEGGRTQIKTLDFAVDNIRHLDPKTASYVLPDSEARINGNSFGDKSSILAAPMMLDVGMKDPSVHAVLLGNTNNHSVDGNLNKSKINKYISGNEKNSKIINPSVGKENLGNMSHVASKSEYMESMMADDNSEVVSGKNFLYNSERLPLASAGFYQGKEVDAEDNVVHRKTMSMNKFKNDLAEAASQYKFYKKIVSLEIQNSDLGRIIIGLKRNDNGSLMLSISPKQKNVLDLLKKETSAMKVYLAQKGHKIDSIDVLSDAVQSENNMAMNEKSALDASFRLSGIDHVLGDNFININKNKKLNYA